MNSAHIVIVGGGISGISCAQTLAQNCPQNTITLISASDLLTIASNVKSKGVHIEEFDVIQETQNFLKENYPNIKVIIDTVIELNVQNHRLYLLNHGHLDYDKLCICTGGKPNLISNDSPDYVIGLRATNTVIEFQSKLKNSKRILIIGNGGIATELVHTIQFCQVIWAVKDDWFGSTFFDSGAAAFFASKLTTTKTREKISKRLKYTTVSKNDSYKSSLGTALGPDWDLFFEIKGDSDKAKDVVIEYKCEVLNIYSQNKLPENKYESICLDKKFENSKNLKWPVYVELTNGKIYGTDLVVSATGVIPNVEPFINNNNFKLGSDGGLLVNNEMLTSEQDIYAAGDVATAGWKWSFHWFQMRLWIQAKQMGIYAAHCISSHLNYLNPKIYFPFEMFTHVTRFFGTKVVLLGLFNGQKLNQDFEVNLRVEEEEYIKVLLKDDKMVGAILIGETDLEETFENLILNQTNLHSIKEDLLNPNFDVEDYFD